MPHKPLPGTDRVGELLSVQHKGKTVFSFRGSRNQDGVILEVFHGNTRMATGLSGKTKSGHDNWTSCQTVVISRGGKLRAGGSGTAFQRGWGRQSWGGSGASRVRSGMSFGLCHCLCLL